MRQARLKAPEHHPVAYYHCISRVVGRRFVLGDAEREQFVAEDKGTGQ
jgi:putative transposase